MFAYFPMTKLNRKSIRSIATSWKPRLEVLEGRFVPTSLALANQEFMGGSGNEVGTAIAVADTGDSINVYTSGRSDANGNEGILAQFRVSDDLANPAQVWSAAWPGAAGYDSFNGVAATSTAVYAAGASYSQTIDTRGDKEQKGLTVSFPAAGGNSAWAQQTPAAPGAFSYGGIEGLNAVSVVVENGQTVLYVTGTAQSDGSSGGYRLYVSKLDVAGNVLWTRTDPAGGNLSNGLAVAAFGGGAYVAGSIRDAGANKAHLKNYDSSGALVWSRASTNGSYNGLMADANTEFLYAVGQTAGPNADFLIEKWDAAGNPVWSRTFDRNGAEDSLKGVTLLNGRLYAAGSTRGGTAGGSDGVVLEIDPDSGALIDTTLWGGAGDDSFQGIAATPAGLHVVGTTQSFGGGGSDVAYVVYASPVAIAPTTTSLVATPLATTGGSSVMFVATVTPSTGALGTVSFLDNSEPIPGGVNVALSGGVSTFSTTSLSTGSHHVTASYSGATGFGPSVSSEQIIAIATAPRVVRVTPNGNIASMAGAQRSRIASLEVVFDQDVELDADAMALALHTDNVTFDGVAQPFGHGVLPTSLNLATDDSVAWVVTFIGNTENGADGFHSLQDGVYDLAIDATKVHSSGIPGSLMAANSTTTFHRLFGDIDDSSTPDGGTAGDDFLSIVGTSDNWVFRSAFNNPLTYQPYLDFDGDGAVSGIIGSGDNFQFRTRFNRLLTWRN